MYIFNKPVTSFLAMTAAVLPRAMADDHVVEYEGRNLTIVSGSFDANDPKRSTPPIECAFAGNRISYNWQQVIGLEEGTACIGWGNTKCKQEAFPEPHFGDIQLVLKEQVTKDGQWEGSKKGEWRSGFLLGTTAFSNRDVAFFDWLYVGRVPGAWSNYYWSRDGDYAQVWHDGFFACP